MFRRFSRALVLAIGLCGTVAAAQETGPAPFTMDDRFQLPAHHWPVSDEPGRIVLAVHGFNDHGGGFDPLARSLNAAGIAVYAYDQRGFGATRTAGTWPGHAILVADLKEVMRQIRQRHPEADIHLVGKSMGGGVALLAMAGQEAPAVAGTVLISPAVWARGTMGWHHRAGLWLGTRLAPRMELSADLAVELGVDPTDDPAVLEDLRRDPLVQRQARIDTLDGLTELMSAALESATEPIGPTLLLYGEQDEIIPAEPVCKLVEALHGADPDHLRLALYPEGFHMLTRYSGAADTHADIVAWVRSDPPPLPSGHETGPREATARLCD